MKVGLIFLGWLLCCFSLAQNKDILVIAVDEIPGVLDPSGSCCNFPRAYIGNNAYEALVAIDKAGQVVPSLATEWAVSEDNMQYTFTLREGVKFHSGNTLTCQDAEYSLRRLITVGGPEGGPPGQFFLPFLIGRDFLDERGERLATDPGFAAVSKAISCNEANQLVVTLVESSADFIENLSLAMIYDKTFSVDNGEWSGTEDDWATWFNADISESSLDKVSAGTNAYQMVSSDPNQLVFKRFADYWGAPANIENVIVQLVPDFNSSALALKNGDVDMVQWLPVNFGKQLEGSEGVEVFYADHTTAEILYFNQNINPESPVLGSGKLDGEGIPPDFFSDIHVRRGFAAAFDQQRLIDVAYNGQGKISPNLAVPAIYLGSTGIAADVPSISYDLELARKELEQAWGGEVWEKGFTIDFVWGDGLYRPDDAVMENLKVGLEQLNPKFKINISGFDDEEMEDGIENYAVLYDYDWTDNVSISYYLDSFYLSYGYSYYGTFSNGDTGFDALSEAYHTAQDEAKRAEILGQVAERANEIVPFIVLPEPLVPIFYRSEIKGFEESYNPNLYPNGYLQWKDLTKE
ncbi:MAG: ABC transporter substrate-binding protein [Trueperaceae bacterium]